MSLPDYIQVLHRQFEVKVLTDGEASRNWVNGFCDLETDTIYIAGKMTLARQIEILFHEVAHAVHDVAALDDDSKEEDFAQRATPVWLVVFRDNSDLLKLIGDL